MRIRVLGSSRAAHAEGSPWLDLGARKPRAVLAALALTPGHPVPADRLADLVWGGEPPRAAHGTLHAYISGLRKIVDPDRASRTAASPLETTDHGYVLQVGPADVDAHAFTRQVTEAERELAPLLTQLDGGEPTGWPDRDRVGEVVDGLDAALATWAGEPYADLPDHPDVLAQRAALHRLRAAGEETRLLGLLALGEHASTLAVTEAATALHPLRERLWALHALALVRAGRQAEALDALRALRGVLADELGLDPGAEVQVLEQAVLRQAPGLLSVLPVAPRPAVGPPPAAPPAAPAPLTETTPQPVGREDERARLHALLDAAAGGGTAAAHVVGEPGIGKTRLVEELADRARQEGFVVAVGRCSQDDGAPPLWAWSSVLRDLGRSLPEPADPTTAGPGRLAFEIRDRIVTEVLTAAQGAPVLLVLDDLHWADEASLRTLAHLLATAPPTRLCVVGTRRSRPEPAGALAQVAEAFARRHATRLDLTGLDRDETADLLAAVGRRDVPGPVLDAWHERSAGNPFFLVELARLRTDDPAEVPATVRDVVTRRLEQLPERAADTLRTAAVAGRRFLAETVEAAGDSTGEELADDLDAALGAGLLAEGRDGELAFSHALAHEAVYLTMSSTRRARRHARVAHALDGDPTLRRLVPAAERVAEQARHWLAAGPTHADRAWRAARDAADQARGLADYGEAARMGIEAVAAHRRAGGADEERYALLLAVARDSAYAARWYQVVDAAFEAIALGRSAGRPDLVAEAAAAITRYAVWTPHEWQQVFEDVIDDLRWALRHVADDDPASRCRLQLALAAELYYVAESAAERRALVDTGLGLARRIGDPALLTWALRAAWVASWAPRWTRDRLAYAEEGLQAARAAGDRAAEAVALVSAATDHLELHGPDRWDELRAEAERIAERERLPYVLLTVCWVEINLAAMRRDPAEVERRIARLRDISVDVAIPGDDLHWAGALLLARLWEPDLGEILPLLLADADDEPMSWATVHGSLARAGFHDQLRERLVTHPYTEPDESWQTLLSYSWEAEAALAAGDRGLARTAYERLAPYAGRMSVAGVAVALGPVDGYLALAAVALGDLDAARAHADEALRLAELWRLPAYVDWLQDLRRRHGF